MSQVRVVGARILTEPGQNDPAVAELAWSTDTGLIDYLGPVRGPAGADDIDGTGRLIVPGLINGHTHAGMGLLRGVCDDLPLASWLARMRQHELAMTAQDIRAGLRLALVEMVRSGTVGFIDMFDWSAELLSDVVDSGLRVNAAPAVFGYHAVAFPEAGSRPGSAVLQGVPELSAEFAGQRRVRLSYGLHAPYTCPPELLADVVGRRQRNGIGIHIHLSETRREVDESLRRYGVSPIRQVADLGVLDGRVHVAHAVHPIDGDLELLGRQGVTVSHNPVSNLKLGAGIAPLPAMLAAGLTLSLGTDSVASNNTLDLFEEIKTGILLHRGIAQDAAIVGVRDLLTMATQGGATALDQDLSGRLAVGEPADLVLLDVTGTAARPFADPLAQVGYSATGADVTDVVIDGRPVVRARRCLTIDEQVARDEVSELSARLRARVPGPVAAES